MKTYWTKKRNIERRKRIVLAVIFLTAVLVITIHRQVVETEIVLASELSIVNVPKTSETAILSVQEHVWKLLTEEGGLSFDEAIQGMAIIQCESRWDKMAIGINTDHSKDLGLWQISEKYHSDKLTREEMFDVYASTRYAIQLYKDWGDWSAWVCSKYL